MQRVSGITGAGPLFARVMRRAMRGVSAAPLVDRSRFSRVRVCPLSGHRAGEACPGSYEEVFLPGTAPSEPCAMHRLVAGRPVLDVGPRFQAWARREGLESAPATVAFAGATPATRPTFGTPHDGDEFLLEAGIPLESQSIPVRVLAASPRGLHVRVDGTSTAFDPARDGRLALAPGRHTLELWADGATEPASRVQVRVRGGAPGPDPH